MIPLCETAADCDDGDPCNGAEVCNAESRSCRRGERPTGPTPCTSDGMDGMCRRDRCVVATCGNGRVDPGETCDDGNAVRNDGCTSECEFSCRRDADCEDGSVCNGEESCNTTTHRCVRSEPLDCNDGNRCTQDDCDDLRGCRHRLVDEDGDGHAPASIGMCGDDCDDTNPDVYGGAPEICDGIDNDCDGSAEDDEEQDWYRDCDGDGYSVVGAPFVRSCEEPAPTSCGSSTGSWTQRVPTAATADCDDDDATRHPNARESIDDGIDQDCDGGDMCYSDADDDGYRPILPVTRVSADLDCNDPFEARRLDPNADCCELDADAHPGQASFFLEPVEDCPGVGFDYDCSGMVDYRYPGSTAEDECRVEDWRGERPACGGWGDLWFSCVPPGDVPAAAACH